MISFFINPSFSFIVFLQFSLSKTSAEPVFISLVAYFQLIQAARDNGALQELKDKLQKQVQELTQRLEHEIRLKVTLVYFVDNPSFHSTGLYLLTMYGYKILNYIPESEVKHMSISICIS